MNNRKGFTLVEVMVAIGVSATAMGVFGAQLNQTLKQGRKAREKLAAPLIEVTARNLMSSPKSVASALTEQFGQKLEDCFKGLGTNCSHLDKKTPSSFDSTNAIFTNRYMGGERTCDKLEKNCPIFVEFSHRAVCPSRDRCSGVELLTKLTYYDAKTLRAQKTKEYSAFFKGSDLYSIGNFSAGSCDEGHPVSVNLTTGAVECGQKLDTVSCNGLSVVGIGNDKCGRSPELIQEDKCRMSFNNRTSYISNGSFDGAQLRWSSEGSSLVRFRLECGSKKPEGRFRDLVYFDDPTYNKGEVSILDPDYDSGATYIYCRGIGMNEGGRQVAKCSARFELKDQPLTPKQKLASKSKKKKRKKKSKSKSNNKRVTTAKVSSRSGNFRTRLYSKVIKKND